MSESFLTFRSFAPILLRTVITCCLENFNSIVLQTLSTYCLKNTSFCAERGRARAGNALATKLALEVHWTSNFSEFPLRVTFARYALSAKACRRTRYLRNEIDPSLGSIASTIASESKSYPAARSSSPPPWNPFSIAIPMPATVAPA